MLVSQGPPDIWMHDCFHIALVTTCFINLFSFILFDIVLICQKSQVESLLTEICDTTTIAEFELKVRTCL